MGMTGARGGYGLYSIVDHSLLPATPTKFFPNSINDLVFEPSEIPLDATNLPRNLDLRFRFTISNSLDSNSFIVVSTIATSFSFRFKTSPSPYCSIGTLTEKQSCTVIVTAFNSFYI